LEAKSGYGLDMVTEMKMLRVLTTANRRLPIDLSISYCGAHAIPIGIDVDDQVRTIIDQHLPTIIDAKRVGTLDVENIDVFCEKGVFEIATSRAILSAGRDAGLRINFHADELHALGGAELAAELGKECLENMQIYIFWIFSDALAVSHLEAISDHGIAELARTGTKAILLPTTAYVLRLHAPPVRRMIESDVIIALGNDFRCILLTTYMDTFTGSDYNPNIPCLSMPIVMHFACVLFGMSLDEALIASTINSAAALARGHSHGALHVGRVGDVIIVNAPNWQHIIYRLGSDDTIDTVIKSGRVVHQR
jgi:imidazolonepropionase